MRAIILISVFAFSTICYGQDIKLSTGLIQTPVNEVLKIQSDFEIAEGISLQLPKSFDLSSTGKFPPHLNQKKTSACTAFALSYALKTYQEAEDLQYSVYDENNNPIDSLIFSPSFLFKVVKKGNNCKTGITLPEALMHLELYGSVSIKDLPFDDVDINSNCLEPDENLIQKGKPFRIANFYRLSKAKKHNPEEVNNKRLGIIDRIKKRIVNHYPIVFGAYLNQQFIKENYGSVHTDGIPIWNSLRRISDEFHAMVIVGYDDDIQSFKVFNSWGKHGYLWMKYNVFEKLTNYDIYAVVDVPYRHHDNYLNLFALREQAFNWSDLKSNEVLRDEFVIAAGIREHFFIEDENYKISNLKIDKENNQIFLELIDKTNDAKPMRMILSPDETITFSIREKEFTISVDTLISDLNSGFVNVSINNLVSRDLERLENFPVKLESWNSGRINNKSYRFRDVNAILSSNGIFSVTARQTNNRLTGWHGRLVFELLDDNGNVLKRIQTPSYGLNGTWDSGGDENERRINFETLVENPEILMEVVTIKAFAYKD